MAIMIPSMPLDVEIRSDEDKIFYKLRDSLPKEVYVAHSFVIYDEDKTTGEYYKSEIDFLIIIPDVGCLIVESKNAKIYPEIKKGLTFNYGDHEVKTDYLWHLPDGKVMKYNGPFRQAARSKYNFEKYLKEGDWKHERQVKGRNFRWYRHGRTKIYFSFGKSSMV